MKIKLIISFIVTYFFAINSLKAQHTIKYQATYLLTYQQDSTDVSSKKSEIMLLQLGNKGSLFLSQNKIVRDSMRAEMLAKDMGIESIHLLSSYPRTGFKEYIYKDYTNNATKFVDNVLKDQYIYEEPLRNMDWVIEEEYQEIAGVASQKATLDYKGRHWKAWFSKELPIPEGPYKFYGLPGLIVKITDDKNHYDYTLQHFSKVTDKTMNEIPLDANKVTLEEFKKVKGNFEKNPLRALEQVGITIHIDANDSNKLRKQGKKNRYNAIELN